MGLKGIDISGALTAQLIDELPVLAAIAPYTVRGIRIRDAKELRVKESDRIALVAKNLRAMGATFTEFEDGLEIPGGAEAARGGNRFGVRSSDCDGVFDRGAAGGGGDGNSRVGGGGDQLSGVLFLSGAADGRALGQVIDSGEAGGRAGGAGLGGCGVGEHQVAQGVQDVGGGDLVEAVVGGDVGSVGDRGGFWLWAG